MSTVVDAVHNGVQAHVFAPSAPIRIALLGVGQVGGALAGLLQEPALSRRFNLSSGLVRDLARPRPHATGVPLTATLSQALGENPDVVVEVLGGLEPARTLILQAIERRIPVVTANKSLLAAHGDELLDAASTGGVPLRYEAAVLAGVPFLGTFANRSLARDITGVCGIVNGTTNFILSEMFEHRTDFATALAEAKRRGYAEPNPANDVNGVDAVEKLCVLLRHFGDWSVAPASISVEGIDEPANGRSDRGPRIRRRSQAGRASELARRQTVGVCRTGVRPLVASPRTRPRRPECRVAAEPDGWRPVFCRPRRRTDRHSGDGLGRCDGGCGEGW